jgi:hypothetical protein
MAMEQAKTIYVNGVHMNRKRSALPKHWRVMSGGHNRHAALALALTIECGGLTQEILLRFIRDVLFGTCAGLRGTTRTMKFLQCACLVGAIVGAITAPLPLTARGPSNVSELARVDEPVVADASLRVHDAQASVTALKASPIWLASLEESHANLVAAFGAFAVSTATTAAAAPIRLASLEESHANLVAAFGAFVVSTATTAAAAPKSAFGEVSVSGTPSAVRVEARQASIVEVLRALGSSFKLRYSATEAIGDAVSGTFYGPLPGVVGRILDGKNYFMQGPVDDLQVQILTTRAPVAQPIALAAPAQPGAAAAPPTGPDPFKECSYNEIPIEC